MTPMLPDQFFDPTSTLQQGGAPSGFTEEDLRRLAEYMGLGTMDERQALLQQQMDMAQMLRQPGGERSSPWGAAIGGLGDAIGNIGGAAMQKGLIEKMGGNLDTKDATRTRFAQGAMDPAMLVSLLRGGM